MAVGRLLIVDDEERIREGLRLVLEPKGVDVLAAGSAEEGFEILARERIDVLLLDLFLPGMDGLAALETIVRDHANVPCIMISGHGGIDDAVRAVRLGAYDYIEKPVSPDRLWVTVEKALRHRRLLGELEAQRDAAREEWQLIGSSPVMERLRDEIHRAAPSAGWVLIDGENGTGKELVARLIHEGSPRRARPFIRLNSAALPKELVESELFGYEAGAFTGAVKRRKGKLEQAHDGTLFLDEVSDMELGAQAKLLRALGTGEVERLGGSDTLSLDVRLLCATNRDLRREMAAGRFREDLYFRICVIPIHVPPLRERGADVLELSEHYLARFCRENGRSVMRPETEGRRRLLDHPWPGNVRELRNLMERLAIMHPRDTITAADLGRYLEVDLRDGATAGGEPGARTETAAGGADPAAERNGAPIGSEEQETAPGPLRDRLEASEREIVRDVLRRWGWNVTRAAQELGVDRATLHRRMRRLGVARPKPDRE